MNHLSPVRIGHARFLAGLIVTGGLGIGWLSLSPAGVRVPPRLSADPSVAPRVEVDSVAFAHQAPSQKHAALKEFRTRLADEAVAEDTLGTGSVILSLLTKPLSVDFGGTTVRLVARARTPLSQSGFCFQKRGELIGERYTVSYNPPDESGTRFDIPATSRGDSLLLIIRFRARTNELPKEDRDLLDLFQLEVVQ